MNRIAAFFSVVFSITTCWFAWPTIGGFTAAVIAPIASSVSTVSGILLGFIMACISLFASAKDNTLIANATLTGHMQNLVDRLHLTMGILLVICVLFLVVLFIPDTAVFFAGDPTKSYRWSAALVLFGVFLSINSFFLFMSSWISFKKFVHYM